MGENLNCLSISYKNADTDIRGLFAFDKEKQIRILLDLKDDGTEQAVILCTCNRTEVYFCGGSFEKTIKILAVHSGVSSDIISQYIMRFEGDRAVYHLFAVASGIDSMVIGEDEILGQTKNAFDFAIKVGTVGYETNMIFKSAITCSKKIKTETELSRTSVSTATLASNYAVKSGENVKVMVIGSTGKTGSTIIKNLISHKNVSVMATIRNHCGNSEIFDNSTKICTINYSNRYEYINECDCIISATTSPHYTITYGELKKHLTSTKKRTFIDLAVPCDIDENVIKIPQTALIGIDYFEKLAKENNSVKMDSIESAKEIIYNEMDILKKEMLFHSFIPLIDDVKEIAENDFEKILYKLKAELDYDKFSAVIKSLSELRGK